MSRTSRFLVNLTKLCYSLSGIPIFNGLTEVYVITWQINFDIAETTSAAVKNGKFYYNISRRQFIYRVSTSRCSEEAWELPTSNTAQPAIIDRVKLGQKWLHTWRTRTKWLLISHLIPTEPESSPKIFCIALSMEWSMRGENAENWFLKRARNWKIVPSSWFLNRFKLRVWFIWDRYKVKECVLLVVVSWMRDLTGVPPPHIAVPRCVPWPRFMVYMASRNVKGEPRVYMLGYNKQILSPSSSSSPNSLLHEQLLCGKYVGSCRWNGNYLSAVQSWVRR